MTMQNPWKPFREVVKSPWDHAKQWKRTHDRPVIGHLLPDVPEEIIHATGALPIAIEGAGRTVSHAQAHIPGYTCSHAMGAIELGLTGSLDVLDGMVIPYVCDTTRNLFHIWERLFPEVPSEFLRLPKRLEHPAAREYLKAEFSRFFEVTAKLTGRNAGIADLAASIRLYNRSRALLRDAYQAHLQRPTVWTSDRVYLLLASAMRAPREEHLVLMEALPWHETGGESGQELVPIYVRGKVWDPPGILALMDEIGLKVVEDEIVTGYRSIAVDAATDTDPIEALVDRHLAMVPYAGYHIGPQAMVNGFVERVTGSGAKGVLFLNPKFCEAAGFDTPDFQKALEAAQIPNLVLETSARGGSLEQLRVRLEAFREMLGSELS
ncbi:MAG: 2-hydroxyacyl-CoA dehydratase family protein [Thermodesulfobacteriota bacterium]